MFRAQGSGFKDIPYALPMRGTIVLLPTSNLLKGSAVSRRPISVSYMCTLLRNPMAP